MSFQGQSRTPEFKRSNRILVPSSQSRNNGSFSSGISSSNFSSVSGSSSQQPLFVPKRRSFGIVIKAHDPDRIPARARRSRSRSRSGSRSRSASVSSLRSVLNRAKSRSLGDIDMEGESIVEEEVDRRKSRDSSRQQSFRNLSSSPRRRSLSRGSIESKDSRTSVDMVKSSNDVGSSRKPMLQQGRKQFSESGSPIIQTHYEPSFRRDRSSSQSTLEVNYRLDNQKRHESNRDEKRGRVGKTETRSRAAQYEMVQQRKRMSKDIAEQAKVIHRVNKYSEDSPADNQSFAASVDFQQHRVTNLNQNIEKNNSERKCSDVHNGSLQDNPAERQKHHNIIHGTHETTNFDFPNHLRINRASLSSDEGTDLDDIPWGRPEDSLLSSKDSQPMMDEQLRSSSAFPSNRSYMGSRNMETTYTNIEEVQPMLPPKNAPKRPPKLRTPERNVTLFTDHNYIPSKENLKLGQTPPSLPPRSFFTHGINEQVKSPQTGCENHAQLHGLSGSNQPNVPIHLHDQTPLRSICSQNANHVSACCSESFHSKLPKQRYPNHHSRCVHANFSRQQCDRAPHSDAVTNLEKRSHLQSPNFQHDEAVSRAVGRPQTVKFSHGSSKSHDFDENNALVDSRRQFKSIANFRSAGLLPVNQNMKRAKSTDILSVGGYIREDPEVGNLDVVLNSKKTKSRLVLDDISLTSLEEFQVKGNKPKLSEEPKRGKLEMWSGLLHFFTICSCLLTTVTIAILSNHWDRYAHKCPLYVENNLQHDRYWGNPSMVPCYMSAYLPLLVILISVGLVFVHGGLLVFWRSDRKSSTYYMTRSFGITVTFFNIVACAVALTVACVLTDGLRQTCLSFKLITDYNFRPVNCQMGFDSLDLNYNMEGTLYLIIFGTIGAWISVILTLISVVMYTIRAGCCRCSLQ